MAMPCLPLSNPQRIWSLARNATGIVIAAADSIAAFNE
jgi:hypothetical protein